MAIVLLIQLEAHCLPLLSFLETFSVGNHPHKVYERCFPVKAYIPKVY